MLTPLNGIFAVVIGSAIPSLGRSTGGEFAQDQTGGLRLLVAMGTALLVVILLGVRKRKVKIHQWPRAMAEQCGALLADFEIRPTTALQTFRWINAVAVWGFCSLLFFQSSEIVVTLKRDASNTGALIWCLVSTLIGFILLNALRGALEVGVCIIKREQQARSQSY